MTVGIVQDELRVVVTILILLDEIVEGFLAVLVIVKGDALLLDLLVELRFKGYEFTV